MGGEEKRTLKEDIRANWAAFRKYLWNKETREFLGRDGKSWGQIGIFYLVFYACLALFWAIMLIIFMQTVSPENPTYASYINVPGLTIRPKFDSRPVEFNPDVPKSYKDQVEDLNNIWKSLDPENQTDDAYVDCTNDTIPDEGQFCRFDREVLGPCRPPYFGWNEGSPCLYLRLNRVSGWEPEDYKEGEVPEEIKDVYVPGNIAFRCMNYKDKNQYSNNTIYPSAGIPFEYYPFIGTTNETKRALYIQPYVAVQFDLDVEDTEIKVQCKTYTANIAPMGGLFDTKAESEVVFEFILSTKAQIGLFYLIYYACLAGFWASMLIIFMQTVSPDRPTYNSYVIRPALTAVPNTWTSMIKYSAANNNDYAKYVKQLQAIWDSLDPANQTEGYIDCSNGTAPPEGLFCRFDRTSLGEYCVPPDFGFDKGKPCAYVSLNRVIDWVPEDYEPDSIPEEIADIYKPGHIAIKCTSYQNKKPEQLGEDTRVYPSGGIPYYYFPYVGTTNTTLQAMYQPPYVAVRFDLQAKEEDIKVQCKTYTATIEPTDGLYDTKFESEVSWTFHLTKEPAHVEF